MPATRRRQSSSSGQSGPKRTRRKMKDDGGYGFVDALFDTGPRRQDEAGEDTKPKSLQARFEALDAAHPEIYRAFRDLAVKLWQSGVAHYGAKAIMEVVRFHRAVSMTDDGAMAEVYKVNNSYTAFYARKLAGEDERFADFFEFRIQRALAS